MRCPRASIHATAAAIAAVALAGCEDGGDPTGSDPVARGRAVYMNVCIACHNGNPNEDGAVGPAIAGSSLELIEAKVLRSEYPEGYEPKRPSLIMPKLAFLEPKIPDLAAFLAAAKQQ